MVTNRTSEKDSKKNRGRKGETVMAKRRKRKHSSRPIVSGYLEKVSANIFDSFKEEIISVIAGHQGVYALYRKNKLYYVGLATDLKSRISHHLLDRHQGKWTHFSLYIIRRAEHTRELESLLLRIADPSGNAVRGKLRTTNLLPKLKVQVKDKIRQEYDDLFKGYKIFDRKKKKLRRKHKFNPLKGCFPEGKVIRATWKGKTYKAWVSSAGSIKFDGQTFYSPSAAGQAVRGGRHTNGWVFWRFKDTNGRIKKLSAVRR
jgi:hypothetical protein